MNACSSDRVIVTARSLVPLRTHESSPAHGQRDTPVTDAPDEPSGVPPERRGAADAGVGDSGSPVGSTLSIILAVVAVIAGFLILRALTDDDSSPTAETIAARGARAPCAESTAPGPRRRRRRSGATTTSLRRDGLRRARDRRRQRQRDQRVGGADVDGARDRRLQRGRSRPTGPVSPCPPRSSTSSPTTPRRKAVAVTRHPIRRRADRRVPVAAAGRRWRRRAAPPCS